MAILDLAELQARVWHTVEARGHHDDMRNLDPRLQTLVRLALVHTEVCEAEEMLVVLPDEREIHRHTCPQEVDRLIEEVSDTSMRLMDMCWAVQIPLTIVPIIDGPTTTAHLRKTLGSLRRRIDRITQSVKRHGLTPDVKVLTEDALECCWALVLSCGRDPWEAIARKDEYNRTRPYRYGSPTEEVVLTRQEALETLQRRPE